MFYSRLEAKQILLDLIRQISEEERRGGAAYVEESVTDYLKSVLDEEEVD